MTELGKDETQITAVTNGNNGTLEPSRNGFPENSPQVPMGTPAADARLTHIGWALAYARMGWRVFPVHYMLPDGRCSCQFRKNLPECRAKKPGKHPVIKGWPERAATDPNQIEQWWNEDFQYNIGMATGNGIVVLDVDVSEGKPGPANLAALEAEHGALPETTSQQTGSGGRHYLFRTDKPIGISEGKIAKGLDIRANGGYVILPPSNHETGGEYTWVTPLDWNLAPCPSWLEQAALAASAPREAESEFEEQHTFGLSGETFPAASEPSGEDDETTLTQPQAEELLKFINGDSRDTWFQVGCALYTLFEQEGFPLWDAWAKQYQGYQGEADQEYNWKTFRKYAPKYSAGTLIHFAKQGGWKPTPEFGPVTTKDHPELTKQWVWCTGIKKFVNVALTDQQWDIQQFSAHYAPLFKKVRKDAAKILLENPALTRVVNPTYWPAQPKLVIEAGETKFNLWRPSEIEPVPGDVTPLVNHVKALFPDKSEAGIVLDYMAFQVAKPGIKVRWALLIQGEPGTGKSFLAKVMKLVLGEKNVRDVSNEEIHEKYTHWQQRCQLVVVEEVKAKGARRSHHLELMNRLKTVITEDYCLIRSMNANVYQQPNRLNILAFTNHKDAIPLDESDRRWCVLHSPANKISSDTERQDYFTHLFSWAKENAPAILSYFQTRPLDKFQPNGHAPLTEAKRNVFAMSRDLIEEWITGGIEANTFPFKTDLVSIEHLRSHDRQVAPQEFRRLLPYVFSDALTKAGAKRLDNARGEAKRFWMTDGSRVKLWVIRNHDAWLAATDQEVIAEYESFLNGPNTDMDLPTALSAQRLPFVDDGKF